MKIDNIEKKFEKRTEGLKLNLQIEIWYKMLSYFGYIQCPICGDIVKKEEYKSMCNGNKKNHNLKQAT